MCKKCYLNFLSVAYTQTYNYGFEKKWVIMKISRLIKDTQLTSKITWVERMLEWVPCKRLRGKEHCFFKTLSFWINPEYLRPPHMILPSWWRRWHRHCPFCMASLAWPPRFRLVGLSGWWFSGAPHKHWSPRVLISVCLPCPKANKEQSETTGPLISLG